jgi:hypothetical protein
MELACKMMSLEREAAIDRLVDLANGQGTEFTSASE